MKETVLRLNSIFSISFAPFLHRQTAIKIVGPTILGSIIIAILSVCDPYIFAAHFLIGLGQQNLAFRLVEDPVWRGIMLYDVGNFHDATKFFRDGGFRSRYNLGNALAKSGDLKNALTAYDDSLNFNPRDTDAQANRSLVAHMLQEELGRGVAGGIANGTAQYGNRYNNTINQNQNDDINANSSGEGLAGSRESSASASLPGNSKVTRRGKAEQQSIDPGQGKARGSAGDAVGRGRTGGGSAMVAEAPEREVRRVTKSFEAHNIYADRLWLKTLPDDPGRYLKLRLKAEHARRIEAGTASPVGSDPW